MKEPFQAPGGMRLRTAPGEVTLVPDRAQRLGGRLVLGAFGALVLWLALTNMPPRFSLQSMFLGVFVALSVLWLGLAVMPWSWTRFTLGSSGVTVEERRVGLDPEPRTIPPEAFIALLDIRIDPIRKDREHQPTRWHLGLLDREGNVLGLLSTSNRETAERCREAILGWARGLGRELPAFEQIPPWAWVPARWPPEPPSGWPFRPRIEVTEVDGGLQLAPPRPSARSGTAVALIALVLGIGSLFVVAGVMFLIGGIAAVGGPELLPLDRLEGPGPFGIPVGAALILVGTALPWLAFRWLFMRRTLTFKGGRLLVSRPNRRVDQQVEVRTIQGVRATELGVWLVLEGPKDLTLPWDLPTSEDRAWASGAVAYALSQWAGWRPVERPAELG